MLFKIDQARRVELSKVRNCRHDADSEQFAEQALSNITGEEVRMFYVAKVAQAIRQAIDEEKQLCMLDAWDVLRWELEKAIGPDKVNEIGGKIQQAIRARQ
jgi:hypothetical protein